MAQQYQPVLDAELAFARQICGDIPIADRKKIKSAADSALHDAARHLAQQPRPAVRQNRQNHASSEPVAAIRDALLKAVDENTTEEVSRGYREEAARRIAIRKRAAIGNIVTRLDALLCLTKQQRSDVASSLADHWDIACEKWVRFNFPFSYAPQVPDQHLKCLTADQRSIWSGLQKIDYAMMAFPGEANPPPDDGWWSGEEAEEVPNDVRVLRLLKLKLE